MTNPKSYVHSGRFPPGGLLLALFLATGIALLLSPVYAALVHFIPFVYINCFITFGFGFACGAGTSWSLRRGAVRSSVVAAVAGFLIGVIADYFAWVFWFLIAGRTFVLSPVRMFDLLGYVAETGTWSIGSATPTDFVLWAIWACELLAIALLSAFAAKVQHDGLVYCERCEKWLPEPVKIGPLEPLDPVKDLSRLPGALEKLRPVPAESALATRLELRSCPGCRLLHVVTVELAVAGVDGKGQPTAKTETVAENLLLTPAAAAVIATIGSGRVEERAGVPPIGGPGR